MMFQDKSKNNIQSGTTRFDIIFSDYARKYDLVNYYSKSEHVTFTNPVDMGGNKITSLGDPMEATDAINRSFLNKRIDIVSKNVKADIKSEISTSLSELTKTNNEKISELQNKITQAATGLIEMNTFINAQITVVTNTLDSLNRKDTLTAEYIKNK